MTTQPNPDATPRPRPVLLPDGALYVPGALAAELAGVADVLNALTRSAAPPAACRAPRITRAAAAILDMAGEAAVQHQLAQSQRTWPPPTPPVVLPGETSASSPEEMIATRRAADIAGVSPERIRQLVTAGTIRGRRTERNALLVHIGDVRAYATRRQGKERP